MEKTVPAHKKGSLASPHTVKFHLWFHVFQILLTRSEFPWLEELENAAPDITREMKALAGAGGGRSYKGGTGEMSTVYGATEGWGTMRIRYMGR